MFVQPLLLALKCIPRAKYEKNLLIMPISLLFFTTLDLIWLKCFPKTTPILIFFAGFQWNMLGDSININNFNCTPIILKNFWPLKITIFGPNLCKKGVSMDHTQNKQTFFLTEMTKADHKLSKTFYFIKISYFFDWVINVFLFCGDGFFAKKGYFQP